ncbi:hypothetical protein Z051_19730 [Rhodococcus rhodochrous KG-21]|uniref:Uncharacterized protein n=1 Tax=Rhodococcus rhodochrous KG-21 TaxID=1441923 RepID=A0A0M9WMI8_RHORH|nr:hypothetical protein Z051_19730 [Rhodococcus rhodochrous KG-21]
MLMTQPVALLNRIEPLPPFVEFRNQFLDSLSLLRCEFELALRQRLYMEVAVLVSTRAWLRKQPDRQITFRLLDNLPA